MACTQKRCHCNCDGCRKTFLSHCGEHSNGCHINCGN